METLCPEDGNRVKDYLISHFKYFSLFSLKLDLGREKEDEDRGNS